MVRKIETWEASDGSHHSSKIVALRYELRLVLESLCGNAGIAREMVDEMGEETADSLSALLSDLAAESRAQG